MDAGTRFECAPLKTPDVIIGHLRDHYKWDLEKDLEQCSTKSSGRLAWNTIDNHDMNAAGTRDPKLSTFFSSLLIRRSIYMRAARQDALRLCMCPP